MRRSHMMRFAVSIALGLGAIFLLGCGQRATKEPPAARPAAKTSAPLPDWAPKNPSPEFLRAARVLKPIPEDLLRQAGNEAGPAWAVMLPLVHTRWTCGWEFFGSLSDTQVQQFLKAKEVRIRVKLLTPEQKQLMERYFEASRRESQHEPNGGDGILIGMYKQGAAEDLSNVAVGFIFHSEYHSVNIRWWTTRANGQIEVIENTIGMR